MEAFRSRIHPLVATRPMCIAERTEIAAFPVRSGECYSSNEMRGLALD
jgi:hypothetical protein